MNDEFRNAIERVWRRVQLMLGRGRVSAGNNDGPVQLLQIVLGPLETGDKRPSVGHYGFESFPIEGCDAIISFIAGDRSNGVVLGTNDQRYRLKVAKGEVAIYDDLGHKVHLTRTGIVIDGGGHTVYVNNAPIVDMGVSEVKCGKVTASVSVIAPVVQGMVDVTFGPTSISGNTHKHGGVQVGSGQTGGPV